MDENIRDRVRKTFQSLFPPELANKLESLELTEDQLKNKDQIYENIVAYSLNMDKTIEEYKAAHPEAILEHICKTPLEQHVKESNDRANELLHDLQKSLDSNPYMGLFVIYFVSRSKNIRKIYSQSGLHRFLSDPIDSKTFISDTALIAEYHMKIQEATTFIKKTNHLLTYTDKIIETYLMSIYMDLCLIEEEVKYESSTIGTIRNKLVKYESIKQLLPFILDEEIIKIRNAFAHHKKNIKFDYKDELISIKGLNKVYRCKDIENILNKLTAIYSGYLLGKVLYMFVDMKKVSLTIKLPKISESDG